VPTVGLHCLGPMPTKVGIYHSHMPTKVGIYQSHMPR